MTAVNLVPVVMAAAAAAAERRHLDALRVAGATAPARARPPEELGLARDDAFARLARRGVLREVGGGGAVYLDEAALIAHRDSPPGRAAVVLLVAGLLIGAGLLLFLLQSRTGSP